MSPVASPAAPPGISRSAPYDLVVVGGGINGCGIAADAAGRGLSVLLAEKGDLAGATSSASSKLIHGGLRYLEQYEFRLVREALQEREVLLRIAPHIVHPLRFVLPHGAGQRSSERPAWMIRAGLFLYDHLARRERVPGSSAIRLGEDTGGAALRADIAKGFSYWDCSVDDARLVVLNARMAARHGAEILTRRPVTALCRDGAVWRVTLGGPGGGRGGSAEVAARAVVNAAGPWAAEVGNLVAEGAAGASRLHLRLVRGSHVVVPRIPDGGNAFILQSPDGRVVFLLPFEERFTLIGTTDVAHADLSQVAATDEEAEYLLETANRYLRRPLAMDDIVWCFAGVRPLDDRDGESRPSAVTRDWRLVLDDADATGRPAAPILHVIGGKITTYRRVAEAAMARLAPYFPGIGAPWTSQTPLPGGDCGADGPDGLISALAAERPALSVAYLRRLVARHGSDADAVLGDARTMRDLGAAIGGSLYAREVAFLAREEWAREPDDVLWRRTRTGLWLAPEERIEAAAKIAALL